MNFIKPDVLYFLLLIVIPIIIHLFNLQKHKKILFSDVYFLTKINEESKSLKQIKRLILLITRILALSAIIFAFALPTKKKIFQILNTIISEYTLIIHLAWQCLMMTDLVF